MTPKQFLDRYTYLKFLSPLNGIQISAGLSNYGSGKTRIGTGVATLAEVQREHQLFTWALRKAHHGNINMPCGPAFRFNQKPLGLIPAWEEFYANSFGRTFLGKASPDEIIDTLRIAMAVGRIGTDRDVNGQSPASPSAQAYVTRFVTLDCNGLAGAYFGVDGDVDISTFASPARRRNSMGEIRVGDAVVTHCTKSPCEHIGVIDEFINNGNGTADVRIVEWGWWGDEKAHYRSLGKMKIKQGPERSYGLGWESPSNRVPGTTSFRYVFGPPAANGPLGWL